MTILFATFKGIDLSAHGSQDCLRAIGRGQQVMLHVQHSVYTWEGSLNKFMVDDKGMSALCVFGLPPMAHADDPKRATAAAKMIIDGIKELGPDTSAAVGITTGLVYCGVIGSEKRREYTVLGHYVNLAARLMCGTAPNTVSSTLVHKM